MLIEIRENVVIGAMVELTDFWLLTVPLSQI